MDFINKYFHSAKFSWVSMLVLVMITMTGCLEKFEYEYTEPPNPELGVDMVTYFNNNPEHFSQLSNAIERAGLTSMLSSGEYTLFAPDNRAFDRFFASNALYSQVDDIPQAEMESILLHHILPGKYLVFDFSEELLPYEPVQGEDLMINYQATPLTNRLYRIFVNGIQVKVSNMEPTNGAIHVIFNGVL